MENKKPLFSVRNLKQYFPVKGKRNAFVRANDGITLDVYEGETLGIVGESGCGKSTLGRVLLQLYRQTDGETIYFGRSVYDLAPRYMLDVFSNLEKRCAKTKALVARAMKLEDEYQSMRAEHASSEDKAKKTALYDKLTERNEAKKIADNQFLNVVQLVGGFYVAEKDPWRYPDVSKRLMAHYHASREIFKLSVDIIRMDMLVSDMQFKVDREEKGASAAKLESLKASLAKLSGPDMEACLAAREKTGAALDEIRAHYADDEEFMRYEAMRDDGIDLARLTYDEMRYLRKDMQLIFQDPYSSLNPRFTVGQIVSEGPITHHYFDKNDARMQEYAMKLMESCGLAPYMIHRYPHQFSGGQRQRIGIARALSVKPRFVVCDEAVSALDVSIQSQIINLLQELKESENLTYMFISHDLSVVKYISDRIAVMYLGHIVELTDSRELFENPMHPYTVALLSAIPTTDVDSKKDVIPLKGDIPSPVNPPPGCNFNTRCDECMDICMQVQPEIVELKPGHFVACHKYN